MELTIADIQADLAERFDVPCDWTCKCPSCAKSGHVSTLPHTPDCPMCQGSGQYYPFQLACSYAHSQHHNFQMCAQVGCLGFTFNPDPEVFWDAVEAKGWGIALETGTKGLGTRVKVWLSDQSHQWDTIAMVDFDKGLQGQAVLWTALHRAMKK